MISDKEYINALESSTRKMSKEIQELKQSLKDLLTEGPLTAKLNVLNVDFETDYFYFGRVNGVPFVYRCRLFGLYYYHSGFKARYYIPEKFYDNYAYYYGGTKCFHRSKIYTLEEALASISRRLKMKQSDSAYTAYLEIAQYLNNINKEN